MKKWLITYLFIVCAICLHAGGFASPEQVIHSGNNSSVSTTTLRTFPLKKTLPSIYDHPYEEDADIFFYQHSISVLNIVVSYCIAETKSFTSISCRVPVEEINTKEVERVLKDYLLHIFPSHYFW